MSNPNDYIVGWICAISTEYVAAQVFLDEKHEGPEYVSPNDNNDYTLGKIGKHNTVIAVLPDGEYGTSSAARVASRMLLSFPNVRIGLMVGIGGGAPSAKHDIHLGDVIVSAARDGKGGVFEYDFGKTMQGQEFQTTAFLNQAPEILRTAMSGLKAQYEIEGHQLEEAINNILEKRPRLRKKYKRPSPSSDRLYRSTLVHPTNYEASCVAVCGDELTSRPERAEEEDNPTIHYGLIASANQLMKDATVRDKLAAEKDVLCFEMEAAGLMNHFPCLVIRGICDYSDSHKNKEWQGYAAMVAASYAKDLLGRIALNRVEAEKKIVDILSDVQGKVIDISRDVNKLLRVQYDQEHETILNWLTPIDYASQQYDYIKRREPGTGQWLLNSDEYRKWQKTSKQTLFCPGIPGAGKTILTAIVVNDLLSRLSDDMTIGIAYIYCNFQRQDEQKVDDLMASLLKQLAESYTSLPGSMQDLYNEHKVKRTRPSLDEILRVLQSVAGMYSRVFIIVDALDECQLSNGCRARFLSEIFSLLSKTETNFFATSRPILDIEKEFKGYPSYEILASDEDVRRYLDGHMSRLPEFVLKRQDLQDEIKTEIIGAVEGIYLYLGSLEDKTSAREIKSALKELQKQNQVGSAEDKKLDALAQAYKHVMERIDGQKPGFRLLAKKVLSWITFAKRPLTTSELQHALAVKISDTELDKDNIREIEDIVSVCAGLVTIDEESNIIRLVHYTTQEYFERTQNQWFPNAEPEITKICITYLSFKIFQSGFCQTDVEFEERLQSNPLYDYAAHNWGHHARKASNSYQEVIGFLESEPKTGGASQALLAIKVYSGHSKYSQEVPMRMTGLHLAAYFGVYKAASILIGRGQSLDLKDSYDRTALSWTAENGHEAVVKLLLEKGAKLEIKDKRGGRTALWYAASHGHEAAVKLLLEKGAELETKSYNSRTALSYAASHGHEAVVKLLLDKGAELETKDDYGMTALSYAARNGHEVVAKLLLEKGAELETKSDNSQTPLSYATYEGHEAVVKLLLGKGAELETRDKMDGRTALLYVASHGHEAAVKLLLEKGAELETKDDYGGTALLYTARNGHEAVVKLLLEKGAKLETKSDNSRTALSYAASYGHEAVVKLLLGKGAELETRDKMDGRTALLYAASYGKEVVVKLLLEKGAELETKSYNSRTALSYAASHGHEAVVKLLLDKGAELETNGDYCGTALSYAARNGHEVVVKLLLEKGAELETKSDNSRTALSYAASYGNEAVVKLLLDKGAELETKDDYGGTALLYAVSYGHEAVAKLLLERGAKKP